MKKLIFAALIGATTMMTACTGATENTVSEAVISENAVSENEVEDSASSKEATADTAANSDFKIAMITDSGDITDQSFNQTTYESCKSFAAANGAEFQYYKPTEDSDDARIAAFNNAVADGYNVVVVPGYLFGTMIVAVADSNPDVTIIALDVSAGDLGDYTLPANVCCFTYQEELPGYMAGYAAVKEGYTKLGFLGGMAVPAVIRYGYGFVQGVNDAAVAPDCTHTGLTAGTHCSRCNETLVAQTTVAALGHTSVVDAEVPATCTSTGVKAYYICHCGCGKKYFDAAARYVYNQLDAIIPMLPEQSGNSMSFEKLVVCFCKNRQFVIQTYIS